MDTVHFHLSEITVLTGMLLHVKYLDPSSILHRISSVTLGVQLDSVFFRIIQEQYKFVLQAVRTIQLEFFS